MNNIKKRVSYVINNKKKNTLESIQTVVCKSKIQKAKKS